MAIILAIKEFPMRHVPVAAFKDKVSEYIAAAEAGDEIIITRHGKVAARLVAPESAADVRARRKAAVDAMLAHRAKMKAEGFTVTVEEMISWKNEGRK
jgi:prevent-host-death family protein